mmetsp:Transcript_53166/g.104082  ORF Transcript_53166/g.104082 Transcript_53166/m.104082 type:complete len:208 (-) Transcript_53166:708-1331(-)
MAAQLTVGTPTPFGVTEYSDGVLMSGWTHQQIENKERTQQAFEYTQKPFTATSMHKYATGLGWPVKRPSITAPDHFQTTNQKTYKNPLTQPTPDHPPTRTLKVAPTQKTAASLRDMLTGHSPSAASSPISPTGGYFDHTAQILSRAVRPCDHETSTAASKARTATMRSSFNNEKLRTKYEQDNCFRAPAGKRTYVEEIMLSGRATHL